jgi:hypothetical protein
VIKLIFSAMLLSLAYQAVLCADAVPEDHVVLYDMKEDPSIAQFIANNSIKGFYGLEIDEERGEAAVLYRVGDILYRADLDLRVKGTQLTLINRRHRKILTRATLDSPSGSGQEAVYPVECPPGKGGWLRGASFGRHVLRRDDEMGERLLVGSSHLEFEIAMRRCSEASNDCGDPGCPEMGAVAISSVPSTGVHLSTAPLSLGQVLLDAKLSETEILKKYKTEINSALPQKLNDLSALTTSYHTTGIPYPGMPDPFIGQRGFKIGVLSKTYSVEGRADPITVDVQPLLAEYQAPSETKCGAWESGPNSTLFNDRGHACVYVQTPATGNAPAFAGIYACGRTISISVHAEGYRTKDEMLPYFDALPVEQMEHAVGGK